MKARLLVLAVAALSGATLLVAGNAGATATPAAPELSLSDSSALAPEMISTSDGSGDYGISTVALDTAGTTATVASDGYLCGNVQYRATQKWYSGLWPNIVLWTYRSTFGVNVCHDKVTAKTALYDEAMDSTLGWGWCGNIVRQFTNQTTSALSYTKGCFSVVDKILVVHYPWARMTIGGNGGLWVRKTGVG